MNNFFHKQLKQQNHSKIPHIRYHTNFTNCIAQAFQQRLFQKTDSDDWDIIWSEKQNINQIYEKKIQSHQKINHFRSYYELCKKDLLIRNLKKHKKTLERQGKHIESQMYNFYPQTYILPSQYMLFTDEFKKCQNIIDNRNIWIMKPTGKSQGKGIFLFNKLSQVSHWQNYTAQHYIVQKYIADPLLIGGKKFDLRLYVLVTSYIPLNVYLYRGGFARFTHCRYQEHKIQQSEIHLTNVAIQKNAEGYDENIGGKWYLEKVKLYLLAKYGQQNTSACFHQIQNIVIKTLEAVQKLMNNDRGNSFQLYGFDVLLDSKLQPWLIQVNGSPSMTANTEKDYQFKIGLMSDTLSVIDMEKYLQGNQEQIGGFDLICKGKNMNKKKNSQQQQQYQLLLQNVSFLGTFNNRIQNLKKIAKNNCMRLNNTYDQQRQKQQKKLMSSHNATVASTNNGTVKRNILSRKSNNTFETTINHGSNNKSGKQFLIKKKLKRDNTNENIAK